MIYILLTICFAVSSGLSEGYRLLERTEIYGSYDSVRLSKKWHLWGFVRNIQGCLLGIAVTSSGNIAVSLLISGIIFWFFNDGIMSLIRGLGWFHQGVKHNLFEYINYPLVKISLLIAAILLHLFIK